jgi:acyl carrier protein
MINALSSTEARTYLQYFVDTRTETKSGVLPAGYPVGDTEVLILDDNNRPLPPGEVGEIVLRSPYIFPGYWKNEGETRNTLKTDSMGGQMLHTGDVGRRLSDGSFEHLGRRDFLCKIRGHRVQIDVVEAELRSLPSIEKAVVVPQRWRGENRLVAYVVTSKEHHFDPTQWRNSLQQRLPEFMVPAVFMCLAEMPMTPSGKIDRRALPPPTRQRPHTEREFVPPTTALERVLANLWADGLDLESVGTTDNFLELGGHSLLAGEIVAKINRIFAVDINPHELMEAITVQGVATLLMCRMQPPGAAETIAQLWSEVEHMEPSSIRETIIRERTKSDNVR